MASRVVLVKTCQRFRHRRDACNATWAGQLRVCGIPVYFVEGGHASPGIDGSLIKLACGDAYSDNSYKVRDGLRVLLHCEPFDSVFICDDDTFVHWRRWLEYEPESEFVSLCTDKIPWAHGGGGWWYSRRCAELYVANVNRRFSGDDVIAWEIMRDNGIPLTNRPDLFSQETARVSSHNDLITCHPVGSDEMYHLFASTFDLATLHDPLPRAAT